MIWTPLFAFAHALLGAFYSTLPPWSFTLGPGCGPSALGGANVCSGDDHSAVATAFQVAQRMNHFLPMDTCILPIIGIVLVKWAGMNIIKLVKFILSLIPTISAGG